MWKRGGLLPLLFLHAHSYTLTGNLSAPSPSLIPNWAQTITAWDAQDFHAPAPPDFRQRYPFLRFVQLFTATGGCYTPFPGCSSTRDLFNDPADPASGVNASRLFAPLWNLVSAGLTPHIVTGNVPIALSSPPFIGGFGFNSAPPASMAAYRAYIAAVASQLVAEFSLARVSLWRWGVFTEYNNVDWLRSNATVFNDIYDHTACGLVDALGSPALVDLGAHACTQCGGASWDPLLFLEHASTGSSACSGGRVHLNFTGNSFYEHTAGEPGDLSWFEPQGLAVLARAQELGLPTQRYGIDEGRLLWGPGPQEGPSFGLTTRAVGPAYQGSFDALLFKLLAATRVPEAYYSRWGLGFSPDLFAAAADTADTVAGNVATLAHALSGLPSVPTINATASAAPRGGGSPSSLVDGVVALDRGGGAQWRVLALVFHHHPWLNATAAGIPAAALAVALCGAPAAAQGRALAATATRVSQEEGNAWPAWAAAAAAANLSHSAGDYAAGWSAWSDSPPLASARAQGVLQAALPALQAAAALAPAPLPGGASVGQDGCLRFAVDLPPHTVALVEVALPAGVESQEEEGRGGQKG